MSVKGDPPELQSSEELERKRLREKGTNLYEVNRSKLFQKVDHV
jgi:hypothetical protein